MNLVIKTMWSPDLDPPSEGKPTDILDFDVFVQFCINEVGKPGDEIFGCTVCSLSALTKMESGDFINHTLVMDRFDWEKLKERINKLLLHTSNCNDWDSVIEKLSPYIQYSDG